MPGMNFAMLGYYLFAAYTVGFALARHVRHELVLTWEVGAPNGQSRQMIKTNGCFPAPTLIFDEDDDAEIVVVNKMQENVSVHWHGINQQGTPWSDGTPGLTQSPIQPGHKFVYKFKASPPGNHWYHSHEKMSLLDGLYGAIHIKPKQDQPGLWRQISNNTKDIKAMEKASRKPEYVVVSDWSRYTSERYWQASVDSNLLMFCVDSILVNGVGELYCPGADFLTDQIVEGLKKPPSPPDMRVTDKGCLPFIEIIQGNFGTTYPERLPPNMQEGCIPSKHKNATITVDPHYANGWVSMHFVAAATIVQFTFSIDEHEFWLYEIDGNYVQPRKLVAATMSAGETFSIMMKLDQKPGRYIMRVPNSGASQVGTGFAEMVYKHSHNKMPPKPWIEYNGTPLTEKAKNESYSPFILESDHMAPWPANKPRPGPADAEHLLVLGRMQAAYNYTMNTKYLYPINFQQDKPLLFYPNATMGTVDENLVIRTQNGTWVDLILQVSTLPGDTKAFEHFMHKHGSKTWRIGFGEGVWNYTSVAQAMKERPRDFNLENPGLRDTWITKFSQGLAYWSVLRYYVDNPGPWLFHCHIELHLRGGMGIAILDGVDAWPHDIPLEYRLNQHDSQSVL